MTARRVFSQRELREAVRLVQEHFVGIKIWPDGSMEIMPPRLDTAESAGPPSSLGEWRKRRGMETAQRHLQRQKNAG